MISGYYYMLFVLFHFAAEADPYMVIPALFTENNFLTSAIDVCENFESFTLIHQKHVR